QRGGLELGDDVVGRHARGENLAQCLVATPLDVIFQTPVAAVEPIENLRLKVAAVRDHAGGEITAGIGVQPFSETLQNILHAHADSPCFFSSSIISSILACSMRTHMWWLLSSMTGASPQEPMHSPSLRENMPSGVVSP